MTSSDPWHVEEVGAQATGTARDAARRAGISPPEWRNEESLDAPHQTSIEASASEGSGAEADPAFAEVRQGVDSETRQLSDFTGTDSDRAQPARTLPHEEWRHSSEPFESVEPGWAAVEVSEHASQQVPAVRGTQPLTSLEQALMEIAQRQRALDGYAPLRRHAAGAFARLPFHDDPLTAEPLPRAHTQDLSGLEQQLRQINSQMERMERPCGIESVVHTLRDDLAEIGAMLKQAMPRDALENVEAEIRRLADRIQETRDVGGDTHAFGAIKRGLAEVTDALRGLTPAEGLHEADHAVQEISRDIDVVAGAQDPAKLEQLERAITAMREIAAHVASNEAISNLSEEVRQLARKVDQAVGPDMLSALEQRISTLADALEAHNRKGRADSPELESAVLGLVERIEQTQVNSPNQAALDQLEERIAGLVQKLEASDARLNHLATMERGLGDLLIHLEQERLPGLTAAATPPPAQVEVLSRDLAELRDTDKRTEDSLEAVHGTLGQLVDRLAMLEEDIRARPSEPTPTPVLSHELSGFAAALLANAAAPARTPAEARAGSPAPDTVPRARLTPEMPLETGELDVALGLNASALSSIERRPIDPTLPPDHPLEPGSGGSLRGRSASSPADRIAASEAALLDAKPSVSPDAGGRSDFIAAARRAAQAAGRDPASKKESSAPGEIASGSSKLSTGMSKLRAIIVGGSAVLLVLGLVRVATWVIAGEDDAVSTGTAVPYQATSEPLERSTAAFDAPDAESARSPLVRRPPVLPGTPAAPAGQSTLLAPVDATSSATPIPDLLDADDGARVSTTLPGAGGSTPLDITGSVRQQAAVTASSPKAGAGVSPPAPSRAPAAPATSTAPADRLPVAFPAALRGAAAQGDAAAQYEVAVRYAEGQGVPQNLAEAAEWFERAAKQGLAPAQFRLGGLYEKGLGVKKDLDTARRWYLSAGEAGHGKALHNLAVLYAEGIEGRPDYQTAARWFRKAADYGIADSQYNLAVLYARGIGLEQSLVEAYRWFALAASAGDAEAAKKRDELGAKLDAQGLRAANNAVQSWTAQRQPEAALQVKTPVGGWDTASASSSLPSGKRKAPATRAKSDAAARDVAQ